MEPQGAWGTLPVKRESEAGGKIRAGGRNFPSREVPGADFGRVRLRLGFGETGRPES